MKLKEILKQKRTGNTWGYLIHVIGQLGMVTQIVMLMINIITLATVLQMRGMNVPTWLIALLAFSIIFLAGIIVFKIGLPSFFSAWNQQWYEHNNPLRKDIEEIKGILELNDNHKVEVASIQTVNYGEVIEIRVPIRFYWNKDKSFDGIEFGEFKTILQPWEEDMTGRCLEAIIPSIGADKE